MEEINRIDYNSNWKKMYFARNYTYLELLDWVHEHLSFTHEPISNRSKDPFRILESGIGKCQEFSILYIFSCLANNYEARLVIAKINGDHAWTEVKIDEKWVHIDPTEK